MCSVFQTTRLRLRQWRDTDRQPFAAMNQDPEVMRYFPRLFTKQESNAFIDDNAKRIEDDGWGAWAVELIDKEQFIGFVGLSQPAHWHPCAGHVDIGWRLDKKHWGQGYATEASKQVLHIAFNYLELKCLVSFTSECNLPSINIMEKIGMRKANVGFDHPRITSSSRLRKHVIYRLGRGNWQEVTLTEKALEE